MTHHTSTIRNGSLPEPGALYKELERTRRELEVSLRSLANWQNQSIIYARELHQAYEIKKRQAAELEKALHQLEETYEATLRALMAALDARDTGVAGHSLRVGVIALAIGRELGIDETTARVMRWGSLLHDVGKIGIPDAVLRKPGSLDAQEWVLMKRHPQIGYDILREIPFLTEAAEIVRCHHERYDGSGYPTGLRGEEIPIGARVFAVADAFDAITSDRPYRSARGAEVAIDEITKNSGSQFDPAVVEAFLRALRTGRIPGRESQTAGVAMKDPSY